MNKYLRAISSNYIFFIINTLFFLIITSLAIRIMGEEMFGLWSILNAILLFSGIGVLGMDTVVNKFSSEDGDEAMPVNSIVSAAILILLPMAGFVALVILIGRNWISAQFGLDSIRQEQFRMALTLTALSVIPQFLGRIPHGYLLSQLKNKQARTIELIGSISMWTGVVLIAYFTRDITLMAFWALLVQTVGMAALFIFVLRMINFSWQIEASCIRRMLSFSGFTFLGSLGVALFQQFDRILVGFVLGPRLAGVYSVGTSMGLRLSIVTGQVTEIMIPYASLKNSQGDKKLLFSTFRRLSKYISLLIALLASVCIIWMHEILSIWISAEYASKYSKLFSVLIIAYGFLSLARVGHQTLTGLGQVKFSSIVYLLSTLLMLTGVYFFSKYFGILGAVLANIIMAVLLILNVRVYSLFRKDLCLKEAINDLRWGLFLPSTVYIISLFRPLLCTKFGLTLILISFVLFIIKNDGFLRMQIQMLGKKLGL